MLRGRDGRAKYSRTSYLAPRTSKKTRTSHLDSYQVIFSLNHYLFSSVDIEALSCGLPVELATVEGVPL